MLELSETSCSDIFFGEIYYLGKIAIECLEAGDIAGAMLFKKEFWHRIAFFEKLKPDFRRIAKKSQQKFTKKNLAQILPNGFLHNERTGFYDGN